MGGRRDDKHKKAAGLRATGLPGHGIPLSALSPNFLHTNSTSHTWPFSAVAELIDNAYDPDVNAKQLWIDKTTIKGHICLIFLDNGQGMNHDKLHKMLSFGFSDKVTVKGHAPVGLYGNGFKSGSMRLGKDAVVFTKDGATRSVGFLSQTYLKAVKAENVIVPIISYGHKKLLNEDMQLSLNAILSHSLFKTEQELHAELDAISGRKGTRIIIWNMRGTKDGKPEFDFDSDKYDIRIPEEILNDSTEKKKYKRQDRVDQFTPESDYSLRAYCSILYLKPRMQIILLGMKVKTQLISKNLAHIEHDTYRPSAVKRNVKITFGFNWRNKEHYGIMMYHKNRLIKPYERVGCQLLTNDVGVGVIGVIECDFLKPTHNKQDFDYSNEYRLTVKAIGMKLSDYWNEKKNRQRDLSNVPVEDSLKVPDQVWVQCDGCLKWRKLSDMANPDMLPDKWFCGMNPDTNYSNCSVPEEPEDDTDDGPSYSKKHKKQEQKKSGKTQQIVDKTNQLNLQKIIQNYGREANALLKEQKRLHARLQVPGQKDSPETAGVSSSIPKITICVVGGEMSVKSDMEGTSSLASVSPLSSLKIMDVKSLSSPQISTDGESPKRKLDYNDATPNPKKQKKNDGRSHDMSKNGDAARDLSFEDDIILLEEKSTPKHEENCDSSKVKKEDSVDMSCFNNCNGNDLPRSREAISSATQTMNLKVFVKEEGTTSPDQSFSGGATEERVQIHPPHNVSLSCSSESVDESSKMIKIQQNLKSMTEQKDSLKATNELLEKKLKTSQKLLEISGNHAKKELCHQWTQYESIMGDETERVKDFNNLSNFQKTVQYMLALKEVELLKQQSQALVNPKQECCIEKEEDKQAQQLEDMSRQLDTCKSERDQLKDKVDQLQKENDAFQLHCANLSNEVECLKQEVTEARPSKSSANTGAELKSLRIGVAQLLQNIIPELDLKQINYESNVVDEILDQVISAS
ncbi:MORC family CW-type zinc finger protein 3-like [Leucoraja erinacea]|uniref:MORC family CW-type zinc finger protein 3-like n=1 Tax=Leucoraja erinaceus TaxID=7782 RepID=UPI002457E29F|nr:MORC family CW-type zinc finger protein 3-like [Leucoraja erinacea]